MPSSSTVLCSMPYSRIFVRVCICTHTSDMQSTDSKRTVQVSIAVCARCVLEHSSVHARGALTNAAFSLSHARRRAPVHAEPSSTLKSGSGVEHAHVQCGRAHQCACCGAGTTNAAHVTSQRISPMSASRQRTNAQGAGVGICERGAVEYINETGEEGAHHCVRWRTRAAARGTSRHIRNDMIA